MTGSAKAYILTDNIYWFRAIAEMLLDISHQTASIESFIFVDTLEADIDMVMFREDPPVARYNRCKSKKQIVMSCIPWDVNFNCKPRLKPAGVACHAAHLTVD